MKHARAEALDRLEPLLQRLRALPSLREKARGVFYLRSKAFLHFHEDPAGLFADIREPGGAEFQRIKLNDGTGLELLRRCRKALADG